jgi:twitching motility protein PilI
MEENASQQLIQLLRQIEERCRRFAAGLPQQEEPIQFWEGLLFSVSGMQLVSSLTDVREILNFPPVVTPVPGTQPWVRGIANVRGNLMPIVDLQLYLGGNRVVVGRRTRMLVIDHEGVHAGLMVEGVHGIKYFPEEFRTQTKGVTGPVGDYIESSFVLEGKSWPVFSMRGLAASESFLAAAA